MLSGLLSALGDLLGSLTNFLGDLLGGLTQTLTSAGNSTSDTAMQAIANDSASAPTAVPAPVETFIDSAADEANSLFDTALAGTNELVETSLVDSAQALSQLSKDLADLTVTTVTTNYRQDGSVSSVVQQVSHEPGALVMMHYVSEVLAPQVSGLGKDISLFMQQTGEGMESALINITTYDLSYSTSSFGTTLLTINHA